MLHYAVRDPSGRCHAATQPESLPTASGIPLLATLGKGKQRLPRGWELALYGMAMGGTHARNTPISEMHPGEVVRVQLKPEYGYAHRDCGLEDPSTLPTGTRTTPVHHTTPSRRR